MSNGTIRVGIGGWTYEPWRGGVFYPEGLAQKRELEHAASVMTAIEINGTYYSSFKPASFENWAKAVPEGFVFTAKASRYVTNRKVLAEAGESIERFLGQGITALGPKLGPILWQFMATKKFDAEDFGAFLKLLPAKQDGVVLRHAVHVRHESFRDRAFVAMARAAGVAIVNAWSDDYPGLGDVSGDSMRGSRMRWRTNRRAFPRRRSTASPIGRATGPRASRPATCRPPAIRPRHAYATCSPS